MKKSRFLRLVLINLEAGGTTALVGAGLLLLLNYFLKFEPHVKLEPESGSVVQTVGLLCMALVLPLVLMERDDIFLMLSLPVSPLTALAAKASAAILLLLGMEGFAWITTDLKVGGPSLLALIAGLFVPVIVYTFSASFLARRAISRFAVFIVFLGIAGLAGSLASWPYQEVAIMLGLSSVALFSLVTWARAEAILTRQNRPWKQVGISLGVILCIPFLYLANVYTLKIVGPSERTAEHLSSAQQRFCFVSRSWLFPRLNKVTCVSLSTGSVTAFTSREPLDGTVHKSLEFPTSSGLLPDGCIYYQIENTVVIDDGKRQRREPLKEGQALEWLSEDQEWTWLSHDSCPYVTQWKATGIGKDVLLEMWPLGRDEEITRITWESGVQKLIGSGYKMRMLHDSSVLLYADPYSHKWGAPQVPFQVFFSHKGQRGRFLPNASQLGGATFREPADFSQDCVLAGNSDAECLVDLSRDKVLPLSQGMKWTLTRAEGDRVAVSESKDYDPRALHSRGDLRIRLYKLAPNIEDLKPEEFEFRNVLFSARGYFEKDNELFHVLDPNCSLVALDPSGGPVRSVYNDQQRKHLLIFQGKKSPILIEKGKNTQVVLDLPISSGLFGINTFPWVFAVTPSGKPLMIWYGKYPWNSTVVGIFDLDTRQWKVKRL